MKEMAYNVLITQKYNNLTAYAMLVLFCVLNFNWYALCQRKMPHKICYNIFLNPAKK